MCTAISDAGITHLFGRTLDLEESYGELTVITPRAFPFKFIHEWDSVYHLSMIGTALDRDGYPLYYDAANESGHAVATLNFPDNAVYTKAREGMHNIASFELIPWILGRCDSVPAAVALLSRTNIISDSFSKDLPPTPLHWLISDRHQSVTVEPLCNGLRITENPFGVLTNAPRFSFHQENVPSYMHLSPTPPDNKIAPNIKIIPNSRGAGAIGLPGDYSSASRFIRALFVKSHTEHHSGHLSQISRFFHVMDTVSQPSGVAVTENGKPVRTVYTSCIDTLAGAYYYTTYECRRIQCVYLRDHNVSSSKLICFPRENEEDVRNVSTKV